MKRNRTAFESREPKSDFVVYGTPLPPLESNVRDDGSFVPIWKQEVTDERGRKRLHGAFTGGFSAGYFNTVGSKEGWTPSTFKSSRASRAKAVQARPEDFMDEEDFAAVEEDKSLETSRDFTGFGSTADELTRRAKLTVMDLLKPPPDETMGVKLLKKMGWKEGQGIGPKVKRAANVSDDGTTQEAEQSGVMHYFAPQNSVLVTLEKKENYSGLGYTGSLKQESIREQKLEPKAEKSSARKGGFGVGILNEEDEDDEDVYEIKPQSSYNRIIGGDKRKPAKSTPKFVPPAKHVFISRKTNPSKADSNVRKCFDGRLPLSGFVLAIEPMKTKDSWYPPPEVPKDWVPATLQGEVNTPESCCDPNIKLDPRSRGALLGETPLPGKSVFDFMSTTARERIAALTGKTNLPPALNEAPPAGYSPSPLTDIIPKVDRTIALGALNGGFIPYADDIEKRKRYRRFLEIQAGLREGLPERKPEVSNGDWVNELNEFANCARIFKPASDMISSRFTSSTSTVSQIKTSEGVISTDPDVLIHRPAKKELSPAEQAAKMGMYGGLTRTIDEFWPTRLLCKRFNVKVPKNVESATEAADKETAAGTSNQTNTTALVQQSQQSMLQGPRPPPQKGPKELVSTDEITEMMREVKGDSSFKLPVAPTVVSQVDVGRNEALEGDRAADDVFKAIFGDGDDDDDDDDDN